MPLPGEKRARARSHPFPEGPRSGSEGGWGNAVRLREASHAKRHGRHKRIGLPMDRLQRLAGVVREAAGSGVKAKADMLDQET